MLKNKFLFLGILSLFLSISCTNNGSNDAALSTFMNDASSLSQMNGDEANYAQNVSNLKSSFHNLTTEQKKEVLNKKSGSSNIFELLFAAPINKEIYNLIISLLELNHQESEKILKDKVKQWPEYNYYTISNSKEDNEDNTEAAKVTTWFDILSANTKFDFNENNEEGLYNTNNVQKLKNYIKVNFYNENNEDGENLKGDHRKKGNNEYSRGNNRGGYSKEDIYSNFPKNLNFPDEYSKEDNYGELSSKGFNFPDEEDNKEDNYGEFSFKGFNFQPSKFKTENENIDNFIKSYTSEESLRSTMSIKFEDNSSDEN